VRILRFLAWKKQEVNFWCCSVKVNKNLVLGPRAAAANIHTAALASGTTVTIEQWPLILTMLVDDENGDA
jgi:hypothetical protein